MFDRVLEITEDLSKKGYDKTFVEKMVLMYRDRGINPALTFLTREAGYSYEKAADLMQEIDRRYIRDNRQLLIFYTAVVVLLLGLILMGIISYFYFLSVVSGLFFIIRGISLLKFVKRNRFQFHKF